MEFPIYAGIFKFRNARFLLYQKQYGWSVKEDEFLNNVNFMDKNLKQFGYEYAIIDYCWSTSFACSIADPIDNLDGETLINMDGYGRLLPDLTRFPSAKGGKGFKPIADYIHGLGLKFGIHIMRGVPVRAVMQNLKVKDTDYYIKDIIQESGHCAWLNQMYGIDMSKPGAQEYINSIIELYTEWEIDFIKIDDLSRPYHKAEIEGYRKAIDASSREIVFSSSPGATPLEESQHVLTHIDMWRISEDFWDKWHDVKAQIERLIKWQEYKSDGKYPDADMIPFGKLCVRGPFSPPRYPNLTYHEKKMLMTLWVIFGSPLIVGGDITEIDGETLKLLTNAEVLSIVGSGQKCSTNVICDDVYYITSLSKDGNSTFAAIINASDENKVIAANADNRSTCYEVWDKCLFDIKDNKFSAFVPLGVKLM